MKGSTIVLLGALVIGVAGLAGCTFQTSGYAGPQPVYAAPVVVEQGAYVDGVVVAPPPVIDEWVFIGGGWFFYHPRFHRWVRSDHDDRWRPPAGAREYRIRDWSERPMHGDEYRGPTREERPGRRDGRPGERDR